MFSEGGRGKYTYSKSVVTALSKLQLALSEGYHSIVKRKTPSLQTTLFASLPKPVHILTILQ